jgi:hypothetical protein
MDIAAKETYESGSARDVQGTDIYRDQTVAFEIRVEDE